MSEWISVENRLPDVNETVLAYDLSWYDVPIAMRLRKDGSWRWWWNDFAAGKSITHWMPLPKPPEAE